MKLTKTIKINGAKKNIEVTVKQDADAKWDSEKVKKDFDYLIDSIMITLLKDGNHFSDVI